MSASVVIRYGSDEVTMTWDGAQASAPILVDGESIGYQTADARHSTAKAVRLVARYTWPGIDFSDGSDAWDALEYDTRDALREISRIGQEQEP